MKQYYSLKCFIGLHDWTYYKYVDFYDKFGMCVAELPSKRKCDCCGMSQESTTELYGSRNWKSAGWKKQRVINK